MPLSLSIYVVRAGKRGSRLIACLLLLLFVGCSEEDPLPAPEVDSISPLYGYPGAAVLIKGSGFSSDPLSNKVSFGNTTGAAGKVTLASATRLTVEVPADAEDGKLTVTTGGGSSSSREVFRVLKPPVISGTTPEVALPGAVIVVKGDNLYNYEGVVVRINGSRTTVLGQNGDGLVVRLPTWAESGKISYELLGVKAESPKDFIVPELPTFSTLSPTQGPPGTIITIKGVDFSKDVNDYLAWIGDTPATIIYASNTTLQMEVPSGAETGPLKIVLYGLIFISETEFEVITL